MTELWQNDSHGGAPHPRPPALPPLGLAVTVPSFAPVAFETLPPLAVTPDGWITGLGTQREPDGIVSGSGWREGHPIGILNHFTAGCGDPHDTLVSRGVSAHGCTLQDGSLVQYVPFTRLSFHAYDQAFYDIGWENSASPMACDFNQHQLCRLAQLNAAVIAWVADTYGFAIPIARAPGAAFTAGLKCHADGLAPGSAWDPKGHWDAPWRASGDPIEVWVSTGERQALDRSPWSADDFVAAVTHYAGGDDMAILTDDEQMELRGVLRRLHRAGKPGDGAPDKVKEGFTATDSVLDEANAKPAAGGGVTKAEFDKHTHTSGPPDAA